MKQKVINNPFVIFTTFVYCYKVQMTSNSCFQNCIPLKFIVLIIFLRIFKGKTSHKLYSVLVIIIRNKNIFCLTVFLFVVSAFTDEGLYLFLKSATIFDNFSRSESV